MLHEVLGQIRSELGFQILNRLMVKMGKYCSHSSVFIFKWIFFILESNEDNHTISNEFELRPDPITDCGVTATEHLKN